MSGHTRGVPAATVPADLLAPLRADPGRTAVLLDVDGTLAPIVRHADEASVPETTRALLIRLARSYGLLACVTGRRAAEARRIVSIGSIAYVGNHGGEVLAPGAARPVVDPAVEQGARRVREFAATADTRDLMRLRVRIEDKHSIAAFHWRGAPDEDAAHAAVRALAGAAADQGLHVHWGRKVLEVRPPIQLDKGAGVRSLLEHRDLVAALYVGDDATDLDAFRALGDMVREGRLTTAVRIGVTSEEGPPEIAEQADATVDGPDGVRALLDALLGD
jgi:trehalose 6-phosphate phosphatase